MLVSHMLLPMVLSSKTPEHAVIQRRFDSISAPFMRTKVFDGEVVDRGFVSFEVFRECEGLLALLAFCRADVVFLMLSDGDVNKKTPKG